MFIAIDFNDNSILYKDVYIQNEVKLDTSPNDFVIAFDALMLKCKLEHFIFTDFKKLPHHHQPILLIDDIRNTLTYIIHGHYSRKMNYREHILYSNINTHINDLKCKIQKK